MSAIASIVLAAGRGTRFGPEPKLLAHLGGKPLVRHAVEAALGAALGPVLLVAGHCADEVREAAGPGDVRFVHNPDHAAGLSTSLRAGFDALPPGCEAALVLLGDMPLVRAELLVQLAAAWRAAGKPVALVPVVDGRRGNPALLSRALAPEIARLSGDAGAAKLLRERSDVVDHPLNDIALAADIDEPAALDRLQARTTPSSTAP